MEPPPIRMSKRDPQFHSPTMLSLELTTVDLVRFPQARLYVASSDWALHTPWLQAIGCTLLWEALDRHCRSRREIDEQLGQVLWELPECEYLNWYHHSGVSGKDPAPCNTRMRVDRWGSVRREFVSEHRDFRTLAPYNMVTEHLLAQGTVVCFCVEGRHRSTASIMAWAIESQHIYFDDALEMVERHPDCDVLHYRQLDELRALHPSCMHQPHWQYDGGSDDAAGAGSGCDDVAGADDAEGTADAAGAADDAMGVADDAAGAADDAAGVAADAAGAALPKPRSKKRVRWSAEPPDVQESAAQAGAAADRTRRGGARAPPALRTHRKAAPPSR